METEMDNDMETWIIEWIIGIRVSQSLRGTCGGDPSNKDSSTLRSILGHTTVYGHYHDMVVIS